jgi:hypothetical protein
MGEVVEVKTDSDLLYPVPRYVSDHFSEVPFVIGHNAVPTYYGARLGVSENNPYVRYAMDMHEMTLDHFAALTGVELVVSSPSGIIDSSLPLVMYQQPFRVVRMGDAVDPTEFMKIRSWKKSGEMHRPLRLLINRQDVGRSVIDEASVDTGLGASTVLHFIEKEENTLILSHGLSFSRRIMPRSGQLKQFIDISGLQTLILTSTGTLAGSGKRKCSLDNSDEDPFDDLDQQFEDKTFKRT